MELVLFCIAVLAGVALLALAARRRVRVAHADDACSRRPGRRRSLAGAAFWCLVAVAWPVADVLDFVVCSAPWTPAAAEFAFLVAAAARLVGPSARTRLMACAPLAEVVRVCYVPAAALACFLVLEVPYNDVLLSMEADYVRLNLGLLAAACVSAWFLFQRRAAGPLALAACCLVFGLANYFLSLFKGQTVLPSDVLAVGTAAQVSVGYTYVLEDGPALALALLALLAAAAALVPAGRLSRVAVARNLACAFGAAALLANWYATHDLRQDYGVKVDVWATRDSYTEFGSVPAFLQRLQEVEPVEPEAYSTGAAAELQAALAAAWDEAHPGYPQTLEEARAYQEELTGDASLPSIVGVMNESFSDLSVYPGVEGYDGTSGFYALDAQERGVVYTSVRGGGTCNSEFEFLCGASLGMLGGGVYPYMFYDLSGAESLPKTLASLGYGTAALHPAWPTNWRRDVVYGQIGFSTFLSEPDFPGDADTLRDMITDRATYDQILRLLDETPADEPQFVFDVTLQNHGGYTTGLLDAYPYDGVRVNGESVEGMSEYLSCVDASEEDLEYLLDQLRGTERKVILVFFGDHQPGFNDDVAEAAYGQSVDDFGLDQVQQRFETPYMIWANYDLGLGETDGEVAGDTSLNYLAARVCYAANLPLTDQQKAILQLGEDLPAVNLNGYLDASGAWHWMGDSADAGSAAADALYDLSVLQYADLFDARGNMSFDAYVAERSAEREAQDGDEVAAG